MINLKDNSSAGCPAISCRKSSARRTNRSNTAANASFKNQKQKKKSNSIDRRRQLFDGRNMSQKFEARIYQIAPAPVPKPRPSPEKKYIHISKKAENFLGKHGEWGMPRDVCWCCRKCNCRLQLPRPPKTSGQLATPSGNLFPWQRTPEIRGSWDGGVLMNIEKQFNKATKPKMSWNATESMSLYHWRHSDSFPTQWKKYIETI